MNAILALENQLAQILTLAHGVFHCPAYTWEVKYEYMFGVIQNEMMNAGVSLDYYDPDTSYEADVRAYYEALVSYCGQRGVFIGGRK